MNWMQKNEHVPSIQYEVVQVVLRQAEGFVSTWGSSP
jgi:hypothetical protein